MVVTTLAVMKARIESEVRRTNVSTQIANAITTAIEAYQTERFGFAETRAMSFATVADQEFYDSDDDADLGKLTKIDYVIFYQGDTEFPLIAKSPDFLERLSNNGTNTGAPSCYAWYGNQLRLGPVPDQAYTVRIGGEWTIAAPASDAEASNPWMTTAERLIRCRAKYELYEHVLLIPELAAKFHPDNEAGPTYEAFAQLRRRTNKLAQQGGWVVEPTSF